MSILKNIGNLLTKAVRSNTLIITAPTVALVVAAGSELSELLSSKDLKVGDRVEYSADPGSLSLQDGNIRVVRTYSKDEVKENIGNIYKENDISWWDRFTYNLKDRVGGIFGRGQDILSQIDRHVENKGNMTEEEYIEAAHQYIKEQIGDTTGKSEEEIAEIYADLTKQFILQITHMGNDNEKRERLISIYSAVIGDLSAEMRGKLAESFEMVATSQQECDNITENLNKNAEYNLTNPDATGEVPRQEVATEYFTATFKYCSEECVMKATEDMRVKAESVITRMQELLAKSNRTQEEEAELQTLQLEYQNLVVARHAGLDLGLTLNGLIDNDLLTQLLNEAHRTARDLGFEADVFNAISNYLDTHPDYARSVLDLRGESFDKILGKSTDGRYFEFKQDKEAYYNKHGISIAGKTGNYTSDCRLANGKKSTSKSGEPYIKPLPNDGYTIILSQDEQFIHGTNPFAPDDDYEKPVFASGSDKVHQVVSVPIKKEQAEVIETRNNANDTKNAGQKPNKPVAQVTKYLKAMQGSINDFTVYKKENHISTVKSCIDILNYAQSSTQLKKFALKQFELLDKGLKEIVFAQLNTSGQIEASKVMNLSELMAISTYRSTDAKEYIEKRREEERDRNKNLTVSMPDLT